MNKQELIEKLEERKTIIGNFQGYAVWWKDVKEIFEQLDEPQKVKVPQCVADWYEKKKHDLNHYIWDYIYNWNHQEESEFKRWMNCSINTFQTLVNMHQFGYEVEKEKRYYVRFKWIESAYSYLTFIKRFDAWTLADIKLDKKFRSAHTRKELEEAGFGWVFSCEGIEIEEVEYDTNA